MQCFLYHICTQAQNHSGSCAIQCVYPSTSHSRDIRKYNNTKKKSHIFVEALHFPSFTVSVGLRSVSSWLEPSEFPFPPSLVPNATRWRPTRGHRWLWPSQTDDRTDFLSSGQCSPSPESPPPEECERVKGRHKESGGEKQQICADMNSCSFQSGDKYTVHTNYMALIVQINIKWPVQSLL